MAVVSNFERAFDQRMKLASALSLMEDRSFLFSFWEPSNVRSGPCQEEQVRAMQEAVWRPLDVVLEGEGLARREVPGDGDCQFTAFVEGLRSQGHG